MNKSDRDVQAAIHAKFGTSKQPDEIFSDKDYWSSVRRNESDEPMEHPRSNPDMLPESVGYFYSGPLSEIQEDLMAAFRRAKLTAQERAAVDLLAGGMTLAEVGKEMGLKTSGVWSALCRARKKVLKESSIKNGVYGL